MFRQKYWEWKWSEYLQAETHMFYVWGDTISEEVNWVFEERVCVVEWRKRWFKIRKNGDGSLKWLWKHKTCRTLHETGQYKHIPQPLQFVVRLRLKCDGTRAETRFRSAKRTSPFNSAGGRQFSRIPAAEVCASAVVMLDTPCSEVVWRVLAIHSIRQLPLHIPPPRASRVPWHCNWTLQLDTPCSEVVWRVLATHSIRQFPPHFPSLRHRVPSHFNWILLNNYEDIVKGISSKVSHKRRNVAINLHCKANYII